MRLHFLLLLIFLLPGTQTPNTTTAASPAGKWQTIDDVTGKPKSIVTLWEEGGKLFGKIDEVLTTDADNPNHLCIHCEGDLKNKPEVGLRILWDMQKDGEQWSGGKILDPHNGKVYRCTISLEDSGKKLKVRGFIGISLIGRTQYWTRIE
jgi:uncharacterized protein (DUF2147 family)